MAIDTLIKQLGSWGAGAPRADAPVIELVFGLFLLSGLGFVYLGLRGVGYGVLFLRLAVLYVATAAAATVSPALGLAAGVALWIPVAAVLAALVGRFEREPPALSDGRRSSTADLESWGWLGLSGIGWIQAGRPGLGVPMLALRLVVLGGGAFFLPLVLLAQADFCVYNESCAVQTAGVGLWVIYLAALWLAFPVASAALLRRAEGSEDAGTAGGPTIRLALLALVAFLLLVLLPLLTRLIS